MPNGADSNFLRIFHNSLVGMILTDEHHIITHVNDYLLQLAELTRQDVIGKTGIEIEIFQEEFVRPIWDELAENGKLLNQELFFKTKTNKPVHCLFSTEKIVLDGAGYWITTIVDISKRKRAEKELADVYKRVTDGFVALDSNWNYNYINDNAAIIMEREPGQMIGKNIWTEFPYLVGSDLQEAYYRAMKNQEVVSHEMYHKLQDTWYLHMIYPSPAACSVFFKDISFRKKNEKKIADSELRFRTLTKTAPVGIFETDAGGVTTYVNETWMEFTGLSFDEAMGYGWLQAVYPEDRNKLIEGWYIRTGQKRESLSEYRLIDKKGKLRWVSGKAIPVINEDAEITGYIGTITDITETKLAIELLKENEERLSKAQRISKTGSWEFNLLTGALTWSREQYRIFELEGHSSDGLFEAYRNKFLPDDLPKLDKAIKNAIEKKEGFLFEHGIVCDDGSIKYILSIGEVVFNNEGKATGIKGTGQDITDSKKYQLEILNAHKKTDTLVNTIDGIVWEANAQTFEFTFVSKKAEEIFGYPVELWITDNKFWVDHIHPDDRTWAVDYCATCTREKRPHDFEYRMLAKDGSVIWLRDIVTVVIENDEPVQLRGIMIDITEKKKAEHVLAERTEQLRELSTHLQNVREDERMNIAREIHDELGQQLTGLKMDLAWLMKKTGEEEGSIKNKFNDALRLVDATVRSIRRISTELRPSIIDDLGLNAALEWLVAEFEERLGIEIKYENSFNDKNINPDTSIAIFRILQESLTNIAKHANAKQVNIKIEKANAAIHLSIHDDGIGFDTTAKKTGLNFGLLGIKERANMMQGECIILSKPGLGTKIDLRVPDVNY